MEPAGCNCEFEGEQENQVLTDEQATCGRGSGLVLRGDGGEHRV